MNVSVRAPGKLILYGEYAVLEGAPALVAAVNRYAIVSADSTGYREYSVSAPNLDIPTIDFGITQEKEIRFSETTARTAAEKLKFFKAAFEHFLKRSGVKWKFESLKITLETNDFYQSGQTEKFGLGSSAALTVALMASLFRLTGENDPRVIFRHALEAHHLAQGKSGSGIDIAASAFGGTIRYEIADNSPKIQKLDSLNDLNILPVWTGHSASTRELVARTRHFKEQNPAAYRKQMNRLKDFSVQACDAYQKKATGHFMELCNVYHSELQLFGELCEADIISDVHQRIAQIVRSAGGFYKPSGAGGGDIGLAFTDRADTAKKVSDNLLHSGFQIINLSPVSEGFVVESE